mgnify:CR=1 FL=1
MGANEHKINFNFKVKFKSSKNSYSLYLNQITHGNLKSLI